MEGDLIGASVGAMAALLRAPPNGAAWTMIAMNTLDLFTNVLILLAAAAELSGLIAPVADAGWKRCGEVQLPQNMAKVWPLLGSMRDLSIQNPNASPGPGPGPCPGFGLGPGPVNWPYMEVSIRGGPRTGRRHTMASAG